MKTLNQLKCEAVSQQFHWSTPVRDHHVNENSQHLIKEIHYSLH